MISTRTVLQVRELLEMIDPPAYLSQYDDEWGWHIKFENVDPFREGGLNSGQAFNPGRVEEVEVRLLTWTDCAELRKFRELCDTGEILDEFELDGPEDANPDEIVAPEDIEYEF